MSRSRRTVVCMRKPMSRCSDKYFVKITGTNQNSSLRQETGAQNGCAIAQDERLHGYSVRKELEVSVQVSLHCLGFSKIRAGNGLQQTSTNLELFCISQSRPRRDMKRCLGPTESLLAQTEIATRKNEMPR